VNVDPVDHCPPSCVAPSTAEEIDGVTPSNETPEYLMQVKLRATRLWVFTVLPVEDKNAH